MPVYEYTALNDKGKKLKGLIDAQSTVAARQKLRESNIYLTDLQETSGAKKDSSLKQPLGGLFRKVGSREVTVMTRQLATLLGAGLPLVQSLATLIAQTSHPQLKTILAQVREEVNEGSSFSHTMTHYPQVFPAFYLNMVRAGEASGTLHLVLERLADFSEKQQALKGRVRAALAYPLFMFLIGSVVLFFLVAFVVPNVTRIFDEMHQTLPLITILLIGVSRFLETFWWVIVAGLIGAFVALKYFLSKTQKGRTLLDRTLLIIPGRRPDEPQDGRGALQPDTGDSPGERGPPACLPGDRPEHRGKLAHQRCDPEGRQRRARGAEPLGAACPQRSLSDDCRRDDLRGRAEREPGAHALPHRRCL